MGFPIQERRRLEGILLDSFEGWYLRHSLKKLYQIKDVFAALYDDTPVGVAMLEELSEELSYLFYIAVAKDFRRKGVASQLLEYCISYSVSKNKKELYAATERDNEPSIALFEKHGFSRISFSEFINRYGFARAIEMYAKMVVVPGEILLVRKL